MTSFEGWLLFALGCVVLALFQISFSINALRRDISEIWKRMKRLD